MVKKLFLFLGIITVQPIQAMGLLSRAARRVTPVARIALQAPKVGQPLVRQVKRQIPTSASYKDNLIKWAKRLGGLCLATGVVAECGHQKYCHDLFQNVTEDNRCKTLDQMSNEEEFFSAVYLNLMAQAKGLDTKTIYLVCGGFISDLNPAATTALSPKRQLLGFHVDILNPLERYLVSIFDENVADLKACDLKKLNRKMLNDFSSNLPTSSLKVVAPELFEKVTSESVKSIIFRFFPAILWHELEHVRNNDSYATKERVIFYPAQLALFAGFIKKLAIKSEVSPLLRKVPAVIPALGAFGFTYGCGQKILNVRRKACEVRADLSEIDPVVARAAAEAFKVQSAMEHELFLFDPSTVFEEVVSSLIGAKTHPYDRTRSEYMEKWADYLEDQEKVVALKEA